MKQELERAINIFVNALNGKKSDGQQEEDIFDIGYLVTLQYYAMQGESDIHAKNAEMGYWLAKEYWGRGIIPKAIEEIVEYGFQTFDIARIFARPFSTNLNSQRVLEKVAFVFEARLKKALFKNGEFIDELIYVIFN